MKRAVYILGLSLLASTSLFAQTNSVRPLSLQECIRLALEHNFAVKIERLNPLISRFRLESAAAYTDPILSGEASHSSNTSEGGVFQGTGLPFPASVSERQTVAVGLSGKAPWGMTYDIGPSYSHRTTAGTSSSDFFEGTGGLTVTQPLLRDLWIDSERYAVLISRKNLKSTENALTAQLMDVVYQVEQTYYDLMFARENIRVQEKALELAERLLTDNRKRVEVGTLAPLDEKQSESQVASSRADLILAYGGYNTRQNLLKNLLSDNYAEWHPVEIEPKQKLIVMPEQFDIADSWRRGLSQRPDLQQARIDLERNELNVRYYRNQLLPAVNLTGGVGDSGRDNGLKGVFDDQLKWRSPFYNVGVIFSMPLSNRRARNDYKASKTEKEQAILVVKQFEQQVMVEIDDAIKTARTNLERVDSTRKAREYAELALDAEQKKLAAGKSTSFQVLQLQKDLTDARTAEIRAQTDYNKSLSEIARREGATLEKNRLDVNAK